MHKFGSKKVCVIAAVSMNGVYGKDGSLPWIIPEELRIFKKRTIRSSFIMGKKTWESLPPGMKPLPGRENIVLTRGQDFYAPGARIASSLERAIRVAESDTVFVGGGKTLWVEAMSFVDEAWITIVREEYPVDGSTLLAPELVNPLLYWSDLVPHEIDKYQATANAPAFDIHHWVRM